MSRSTRSSRILKIYVIPAVLLTICLGVYWAYSRSQQVPEYYQRAKARVAEREAAEMKQQRRGSFESGGDSSPGAGSADKLNRLLATLGGPGTSRTGSNQSDADEWLAQLTGENPALRIHEVFDEDDINAWLTKELPGRFQHCLPPGVSDLQVELTNGSGRVGFRYQQGGLDGVVTLDVDVAMTGQGSQLGVRLQGISMGALPLPVGKVLDLISDAGTRSQGPAYRGPDVVRWTQQGGDHVALLPGSGPGGRYFNRLESFSLRNGEVEIVIQQQPIQRR